MRFLSGLFAGVLTLALWLSPALCDPVVKNPVAVGRAIKEIVDKNFYRPVSSPTLETPSLSSAAIDEALAGLGASHTHRFQPDQIVYYEILDTSKDGLVDPPTRLFATDGSVVYAGIGMITQIVGGKRFATDVYDGSPAAKAGIRFGDEIIAVDGKPYEEITSFAGEIGKTLPVTVRRSEDEAPFDIPVTVATIWPNEAFVSAVSSSVHTMQDGGRTIGYIRLWSLSTPQIEDLLRHEISKGRLKDADGLVVDLRGRLGGRLGKVHELLGDGIDVELVKRGGDTFRGKVVWNKPIVGIVDEGTRSAMEILAYSMKKEGALLVGKTTAGAVLSGKSYILSDDSLLLLAVADILVDGKRLEGVGVSPDIEVENPLPYAAGADPQLEAAISALRQKLSGL
ncbi:S41 family peptidase [Mesorhizobium sp. IMUNJ 23232]|uniref:S41 family peptidase n=1 Tax=Mesorhizobium sp. IMUNJ 23232 TaxID=3376064 RepID=UPI0037ABB349